jgi:phospholipid/cholesterol/gamma-HCH transport system ATP-binding protein
MGVSLQLPDRQDVRVTTADSTAPIVELKHVSLRYGAVSALRDVNLALAPGESRIIFGAAGSGKTTLLKAVMGLVKVDEGQIKLFGQDVTGMSERELFELRARTGFVFQEVALFDSLTVQENVEYPLITQRNGAVPDDADRRVREALRFVELEGTLDKFPSELSGGMRRRVGIARAIVAEPPLVLYDSPTAGLDPITANLIMALILKERDTRNTASLVVSHRYQDGEIMADFCYDARQQQLRKLSDREERQQRHTRVQFVVMREGEIVFLGTLEELEASQDEYVRRFIRREGDHAQ